MGSFQTPMMAVRVAAREQQQRFPTILHYLAPALVLAYFMLAVSVSTCTLQNLKTRRAGPRKVLVCLVSLIVVSFLVESCMLLADSVVGGARHSSTHGNVSAFPNIYKLRRDPLGLIR